MHLSSFCVYVIDIYKYHTHDRCDADSDVVDDDDDDAFELR